MKRAVLPGREAITALMFPTDGAYASSTTYLFEEKGKMQNASFADYHIYSMRDRPPIKAIPVSSCENSGPFGAKSVSEICLNGPAPAIGVRLNEFPFVPEKVLAVIKAVKRWHLTFPGTKKPPQSS